ncbi:MAG: hypothetical protein IK079_02080 [Desulfovibrio sp.]|nr:hypothetical protein [Desulfovibrio sp.]
MSSYKASLYVGGIRIGANVVMIAALFLAMYLTTHTYGGILTFCAWFFGVTIPVWFFAWYLIKQIRKQVENAESYIVLPGCQEPCLVHWRVCEEREISGQK